MNQKLAWNVFATLAAAGAAWAGRKAATSIWSGISSAEAPVNPADRSVTWQQAAGWAVLAGLTAAMARVLARRGAAAAWETVKGDAPPGVEMA